jgi:hypothetical protein
MCDCFEIGQVQRYIPGPPSPPIWSTGSFQVGKSADRENIDKIDVFYFKNLSSIAIRVATDKRTNRHKRWRIFFFALVTMLLVLNICKTIRDDRATAATVAQTVRRERRLVLGLLNGVAKELVWNLGVIQRQAGAHLGSQ